MKGFPDRRSFLARYFPVFMGTIFMAIFSGSVAVSTAGVTYLRGVEPALKANYSGAAILVLVAVLVACTCMGIWLCSNVTVSVPAASPSVMFDSPGP